MERTDLESALEAILFALGEPIEEKRLAQATGCRPCEVGQVCRTLASRYEEIRAGIRLVRLEDSWQMVSAPQWGEIICGLLARKKPDKLSQAALETLAIVAYFQPVTRAYLDQARGVDSAHSLALLLDRELVAPCGKLAAPGRPILYRTTQAFLRTFGLSTLEELPPLPDGVNQGKEGGQ